MSFSPQVASIEKALVKWNQALAQYVQCDIRFRLIMPGAEVSDAVREVLFETFKKAATDADEWIVVLETANGTVLSTTHVHEHLNDRGFRLQSPEISLKTSDDFYGMGLTSLTFALTLNLAPFMCANPSFYLDAVAVGTLFIVVPYKMAMFSFKWRDDMSMLSDKTPREVAKILAPGGQAADNFERAFINIPNDAETAAFAGSELLKRLRSTSAKLPFMCRLIDAPSAVRNVMMSIAEMAAKNTVGYFGIHSLVANILPHLPANQLMFLSTVLGTTLGQTALGKVLSNVCADLVKNTQPRRKIASMQTAARHALQFLQLSDAENSSAGGTARHFSKYFSKLPIDEVGRILQSARQAVKNSTGNTSNVEALVKSLEVRLAIAQNKDQLPSKRGRNGTEEGGVSKRNALSGGMRTRSKRSPVRKRRLSAGRRRRSSTGKRRLSAGRRRRSSTGKRRLSAGRRRRSPARKRQLSAGRRRSSTGKRRAASKKKNRTR